MFGVTKIQPRGGEGRLVYGPNNAVTGRKRTINDADFMDGTTDRCAMPCVATLILYR